MFDATFKILPGSFNKCDFKYQSIISVVMTLRYKCKQIKITLKQFLIFFFEKIKNLMDSVL
jgi:hypothetical protein